jgi:hypothetical protein
MSPYYEIGLSNNVDPPFILGRSWKNASGDSFVVPIPDLLRGSGLHYSSHGGNYLHIKSNRRDLKIREIIDLQSLSKKMRTVDKSMIRPPVEGQPGSIFIFNMEKCLNRIATFPSQRKRGKDIQKLLLNMNVMSRSTVQIDIDDMKMMPQTMNILRLHRHAVPGDLAMIYGHHTNEVSLYKYPYSLSQTMNGIPFMTVKLEGMMKPSIDSIKEILPFVDPLIDPTMRAIQKVLPYLTVNSYNSDIISLNPSYHLNL